MVAPDSPAQAAGFNLDDELVSIDGVPIADKETSNRIMSEKRWGDTVVFEVLRDGKPLKLTAYLRRKPPAAAKTEASSEHPKASPADAGGRTPGEARARLRVEAGFETPAPLRRPASRCWPAPQSAGRAGHAGRRRRPAARRLARHRPRVAPLRHSLQVTLDPGKRRLSVVDTVTLPAAPANGAGSAAAPSSSSSTLR